MRIFFKNFGCKVNQSELDSLNRFLCASAVTAPENADIAIVNTCAVTESAEKECLKYLLKLKRDNPVLKVIATGCLISLREEELMARDIIYAHVSEVPELLHRLSAEFGSSSSDENIAQHTGSKTRAFLKIQDGCDRYCSYCIIPYLRGGSVSRPFDEIITEAQNLISAGYKELVVTGINIGLYDGLPKLLQRLASFEGEYRLRLSSLHLDTVPAALEAASASDRIVPHFHISLQSGSRRILSLMGRNYTPENFIEAVFLIRSNFPYAGIGADIITAFPSETDEEFMETYALLDSSGMDYLHVFPYSPRAKTKAAELSGRINPAVRKERVRLLRELGKELRHSGAKRLSGQRVTVLTETGGKGYSENYYLIRTPAAQTPNVFITLTAQNNDFIL
jgi:threonylcarbamoyladenosine tRNA methylthiotransferase MtaB